MTAPTPIVPELVPFSALVASDEINARSGQSRDGLDELAASIAAKGVIQALTVRRLHSDPEFKAANAERAAERMRRLHSDPEFKAAHAERMRRLHSDPEFKAAHAERAAERMRRLHSDPEFKAANAERMRRLHSERRAISEGVDIGFVEELVGDLSALRRTYGAVTSEAVADWFGISTTTAERLLGSLKLAALLQEEIDA